MNQEKLERLIKRTLYRNGHRRRCPFCKSPLFFDTNECVEYDLHCATCKLHFASQWHGRTYNDWGECRSCRSISDTAKSTNKLIHDRFKLYDPVWTLKPSKEQLDLEQKLKDERQSSIIPTKEFHDLFCKVMREESNRECKCYGEDLKA